MAILIVEDNATNAMIIKHLAKKVTEHEIVFAADGVAALALCHKDDFAMLIVDNMLPGMSGLQFVKAVRLMERYRSTPVVMVTADSEPRLPEEARMAGVTDILRKPVEAIAFRQLIAAHLAATDAGSLQKSA